MREPLENALVKLQEGDELDHRSLRPWRRRSPTPSVHRRVLRLEANA
jgi:hypothetical protein